MVKEYKVYFNNSQLLISNQRRQMNENFTGILVEESEAENFLRHSPVFFDGQTETPYFIFCAEPQKLWNVFLSRVQLITAGGGIVFNENNELLLIHRRGKWDLPKGKIEPGEEISTGAIREVEEETAVKVARITALPILTYHAYMHKGKASLKETCWYPMQAQNGQFNLIPQTEEDIDQALWVKKTELDFYQAGSHPLIWDLISSYAE